MKSQFSNKDTPFLNEILKVLDPSPGKKVGGYDLSSIPFILRLYADYFEKHAIETVGIESYNSVQQKYQNKKDKIGELKDIDAES